MRTKDITLSSSVVAIYLVTQLLGASLPINFSTVMISALFGLFWHYLPLKINLTFILSRFVWNAIGSFRFVPRILAMLRLESIGGLAFLDWVNYLGVGGIYDAGYQILELTAQGKPTLLLYVYIYSYILVFSLITPYCFYRYFKWKKVFNRIPSF